MPPSIGTAHRWHPSSPWTLRIPLPGTAKDSSHHCLLLVPRTLRSCLLHSPQLPGRPGHSPRGGSEIPEVHLSGYAFSAPSHRSLGLTGPLFSGLHKACNQREVFPGQMKRKGIFTIMPLFVFLSSPPVPFRSSFLRKRKKWSFQIRLCTLIWDIPISSVGNSQFVVPEDPLGLSTTPPSPTLRPHTPRSTQQGPRPSPAALGSGGTSYFLLRFQLPILILPTYTFLKNNQK